MPPDPRAPARSGDGPGRLPRVLLVGAFPPPGHAIRGGNVTACGALLRPPFADRLDVVPFDSTQRTLPVPPLAVRAWFAALRVGRFLVALERSRPDAVLLFSAHRLSFVEKALCAAYARLRGRHTLLFMRAGPFRDDWRRPWFRPVASLLVRMPHLMLAQGPAWHRFFVDEVRLAPERCPVVENWLESPALLEIGRRRGGAGAEVRVVYMGWLIPDKGLRELLDAFERLSRTPGLPPLRLRLAGEGPLRGEIAAWIDSRGMQGRVELLGWVDAEGRSALLEWGDVFCLPSYAEGMPNSLVEAMAAGLAPVVTAVGAVPDVIDPGVNGILIPARDPDALARALEALARDGGMRERLGREAHRTAASRFGLETAAGRLVELITRSPPPPAGGAVAAGEAVST